MSFYSLFNMTDAEYQALTATELQLTGSTYVNLETFSGDVHQQQQFQQILPPQQQFQQRNLRNKTLHWRHAKPNALFFF